MTMTTFKCPCGSTETEFILTPEKIHYGKTVCNLCGKFVKWVANPNIKPYKVRCAELIGQGLIELPEDEFILSCKDFFEEHGALTEKQYLAIENKLGE